MSKLSKTQAEQNYASSKLLEVFICSPCLPRSENKGFTVKQTALTCLQTGVKISNKQPPYIIQSHIIYEAQGKNSQFDVYDRYMKVCQQKYVFNVN